MRYITFDNERFLSLPDGLAFDIRWDATRSNWRVDYMTPAERAKAQAADRTLLGSTHLRDMLPERITWGGALVTWDYYVQSNATLAMLRKAVKEGLYHGFNRKEFVDVAGGNMSGYISRRMSTAIQYEQARLDEIEHQRRRDLYSIGFSAQTATTVTLTVTGGPSGNTSRWEARHRRQGTNSWGWLGSQASNVFNVRSLVRGTTYEYQVRRIDDEYKGQEVWSATHTRIQPTS